MANLFLFRALRACWGSSWLGASSFNGVLAPDSYHGSRGKRMCKIRKRVSETRVLPHPTRGRQQARFSSHLGLGVAFEQRRLGDTFLSLQIAFNDEYSQSVLHFIF